MLDLDLKGRIAVVTGASGELGRSIARTLADCNARVVLHYLNGEARATQLREEIQSTGGEAITIQADVSNKESVFNLRDQVRSKLGPADIIVNNAVQQYEWTSVLNQEEEDYESQFKTCVIHNVLMAKAFIPDMINNKWGRVVATNTECTMQCNPNQSAYISGKAGQDRVLRVLASEVGEHGITVNQVAPGWMISDRFRKDPIDDSSYVKNVPLGHRGEDRDIANAVAFLASDLASFITGVYLPVAGGNVTPRI